MSTAGRNLLSSLVHAGDLHAFLRMKLDAYLFRANEVDLFNAITLHVSKYGALPKQATLEKLLPDSVVKAEEPPKFYLDQVRQRHVHSTLKSGVAEITLLLKDMKVEEALDAFTKVSTGLYSEKFAGHVTDFRDAQKIVYAAYVEQKATAGMVGLRLGWDTVDEMVGGLRAGDFAAFVGRPMMGKTFKMLYTAHNAWKHNSRKPLLVSMEMEAVLIHQRLAAMDTKTKLTHLMKAELSTASFKKMMDALHENADKAQPFHVVDGRVVSTVDDLVMQCNILQPDCVWVDAAYLLKHPNARIGKFEKQSENAEDMKKRVATDLGLPLICSYQLSKESAKAKKKDKNTENSMEDIYGADAIAQISSLILGLFQHENDIEALRKRVIDILKGRSGERGQFTINWDFSSKMDFTEFKKEDPKEMQMEHLG